ncbi:MAG: hypothetical protein ACRDIY_15660 [Chloroflexota bacterium]
MALSWSDDEQSGTCQHFDELASEIDRALDGVTPRAAAVTLMLFDRVVARYERENGCQLSDSERATILTILRHVVSRDSLGKDNAP